MREPNRLLGCLCGCVKLERLIIFEVRDEFYLTLNRLGLRLRRTKGCWFNWSLGIVLVSNVLVRLGSGSALSGINASATIEKSFRCAYAEDELRGN